MTSASLRLLSWNIRQGGGSRLRRQVDVIAGVEPDVVALQEVVTTTAPRYCELLAGAGLAYFADSFSVAPDPTQLVGARRYGLLVLSRWPVETITDVPVRMPWPERLLSTRIRTPFGVVEVHTAHIPPGASHRWLKIETFEGIYERLARPCPDPQILCGDFNSPQDELETGEVITWGQVIRKNGSVALVRHRDAIAPGRWDAGERSIVGGLVAHGFRDAYRTVHGYSTREYSWVLPRKTGGVRRRFDHIFASAELRPTACRYLHEAREAGLSDHSPMLADFDCGPLGADGSKPPADSSGHLRRSRAASERTIGIDLSAQAENTAGVVVEWMPEGGGRVLDAGVLHPLSDEAIEVLVASNPGVPVGIDAPFGWPTNFEWAISQWSERGQWPEDTETRTLRFRETDLFVRDQVGWYPLSVSTDRIAMAAFRCARLLVRLSGSAGVRRVDGSLMEVYPAAALAKWGDGLPHRGYKGNAGARSQRTLILEGLERRARLAVSDGARNGCLNVDHCLDALICALVARAAELGRTLPPPSLTDVLRREGWIEIPDVGSLDSLAIPTRSLGRREI